MAGITVPRPEWMNPEGGNAASGGVDYRSAALPKRRTGQGAIMLPPSSDGGGEVPAPPPAPPPPAPTAMPATAGESTGGAGGGMGAGGGGAAAAGPAMESLSNLAASDGLGFGGGGGGAAESWDVEGWPELSIPGQRMISPSSRALANVAAARGRVY